ncbi:GNAT family N-acetyltransferase [Paenibacillus sp. y28]|uniref:GNAT family N-acetyltransferase n=1 Tax=Paenibacillus sp. y28 TaxID=3129110 RepID=UPI00301995D7
MSAYRKELVVFARDGLSAPAVIRNYTAQDFDELIQIQSECFPPPFPSELWWNREQLTEHVTRFPEGAVCVELGGQLAGSMTGLRVHYFPGDPDHTWEEITDNGYIRNHRPDGNTLYIVDISIRPAFRQFGLGKQLMQAMYELVIQLGLDRLLGGGRMPGYHKHARLLTAEQYLDEVIAGRLTDPVVTFLLRCGRTPVKVSAGYLEDEESLGYAALLEWRNPFRPQAP